MSQLRSAISQITGFDPVVLTDAELRTEIAEAMVARQMLEVAVTNWLRELTDRGGLDRLGYSSTTSFLTHQTGMSPGRAKQLINLARAKQRAPHAYAAWSDGRISTEQARTLMRAAEGVPDAFPDAEERLVEFVEGLDDVDTRKAVEYWRQSVDGPGELDDDTQDIRRGLSASWARDGMLRVDGWLTPTAGEAFLAGVEANKPPRRDDDVRTPRQRRHDALENLCRDWLDNGTTPTIGGEKPHINLHADLPALQGIAGGLHESTDGVIWDVDILRMIACDCSITRIVFGSDSEVLDVGRKTRIWTTAQRRAIIARDRHCQGQGCRAKARHCDIHHLTHWADGGETVVEEGVLLCRPCHTLEHRKERLRGRMRART